MRSIDFLKMRSAIPISALILLAFATQSHAQPQIRTISGTIVNGQTLAIYGFNFGSKANAAPYRWDPADGVSQYSGLVNGDVIPSSTGGYWDHNPGSQYHYNTDLAAQRGVSAANFESDLSTQTNRKLGTTLSDASFDRETYISFWIYHSSSLSSSDNVKTVRFWKANGDQTSTFTVNSSWVANGPWVAFKYDGYGVSTPSYCGSFSGVLSGGFVRPVGGEWERVEFYLKQESVPDASDDGEYWVSQTASGSVHEYSSGYPIDETCATITSRLRWMTFGYENNTSLSNSVLLDDIYIDNTRARVEICDSATWSARTHCEVQPPALWNNGEIQVALNQGSFSTLNDTYIYVVDLDGNANANGWRLLTGSLKQPTNFQKTP